MKFFQAIHQLVELAVEHGFVTTDEVEVFGIDHGCSFFGLELVFKGVGVDQLDAAESPGDGYESFDEDFFQRGFGKVFIVQVVGQFFEVFFMFKGVFDRREGFGKQPVLFGVVARTVFTGLCFGAG